MKKMKKIAATLLCLGVAISTLCACSSTDNGGEQPAEETTTKQTEAVTEATEPTIELTESETTEAETPEGDVVIELFEPDKKYRESEKKFAIGFYGRGIPSAHVCPAPYDALEIRNRFRYILENSPMWED